MSENYSILVNTSDGFEDCWNPFFTLFKKYWPSCAAPIYLNTETKIWQHPSLNINCTAVQGNQLRRLTWSECLIGALDQINTPLVLYFQEDYFIHQPVRVEVVASAVEHMISNPEVKHIALTRLGSLGPYEPYSSDEFQIIRQSAKYRISTQAALWRVDALKSYLRAEENGWMFEIYGTWRARRISETFLCARNEPEDGGPAIDYLHTGIIKGKWLREIQPVFERHGIEIEYEQRGFYQPKIGVLHKLEVGIKLLSRPIYFLRQLLL
jgi:hypothetical protein